MNKRLLSLLLAAVMIFSCLPFGAFAVDSNSPKITVVSQFAAPNSSVQVDLKITNNPGIAGATLTVAYDSNLTLTDATSNGAFSDLGFTKPGKYTSPCNFIYDSESEVATEDGVFLTLTFAISEDVNQNESLPIMVSYRNGDIFDGSMENVYPSIENGSVTVINYIPGDVNSDNYVNGKDVTLLRRYIAGGYDVIIDENAADVNDDNTINGKDVTLLRRFNAGGYDVELKPHTVRCFHEMTATEAVAATCEEDGNLAYWYCSKCDKYFSDEEGTYEIALSDTIIKAKGHTIVIDSAVPATETSTGLTEGSHCSVCNKVLVDQLETPMIVGTEYNIRYILSYTVDGYDSYLATQQIEIPTNKWKYSSQRGAVLPIVSNKEDVKAGNADVAAPDGYSFVGWFTAPEGGTIVTEIEAGTNGDKTYYARWRKIQYTVQYKSDVFVVKDSDTYTVDTGLTLSSPRLSNYTFVGWTDEKGTLYKNTNIPVGTTGNLTLTANWTSERNKTFTKPKLDKPIIVEDDETDTIFFTYEIGEIQNVPVNTIYDFGYIAGDGVTREKTETYSTSISEVSMNSFTNSVSNATTKSSNWTLSSDWNKITSINEEKALQKVDTIEEAETIAKSDTNTWNVSSGTAGSSAVTSSLKNSKGWSNDVKVDLNSSHKDSSSDTHTDTKNNEFDINGKLTYTPKNYSLGAEFEGIGVNAGVGGGLGGELGLGYKHEWGSSDTHTEGQENSVSAGFSAGQSKSGTSEASTSATSSSSWNSSQSFGGSNTNSASKTIANTISESIAETYGYGEEYKEGGSSSETSGLSSTQQNVDEYSSSVTFSKETSESITETWTTKGTKPGYHRWVQVGKAHVFAVVGYDMRSQSYFVYTYSVMDAKEPLQSFEDYSYVTGDYNDAENGVIPFEVPYEVAEYVAERTCYSNGLKVNQATGLITGYNGTDNYVVIPEYMNVGNGDVVRITGISQNTFRDNANIKGVRLSDFITEIPDNAFENCTSLLGINGGSISKIGQYAFKNCVSLEVALVDNSIKSLGNYAFDGCDRLLLNAANSNTVVAATNSGAKKIQIYVDARIIDGGTAALDGIHLCVPNTTEFFVFSGYENTYPGFTIDSDATQMVIHKTGFDSTDTTPIKASSADIVLNQVTVKADGWGIILTSDNTNLLLQSNIDVDTNGDMSVLCKNLVLGEYNEQVDGILDVSGKVYVCGDVTNPNLLARNGEEIEFITLDIFNSILNPLQIQFDPNGGSIELNSKRVFYGGSYGDLPTPTRDYYSFDGWYTEKSGGTKITSQSNVTALTNQILYAHWTLNSFIVTFNANGGSVGTTQIRAYCGQTLGTLPTPSRTGFTFNGWYTTASGGSKVSSSSSYNVANDFTVYAHWTVNSYTASWSSGTGYSISVRRTGSPNAGASIGTLGSGSTIYYGDTLSITYSAATGYNITSHGSTSITVTGNINGNTIYASASKIVVSVPSFNWWHVNDAKNWLTSRGINVNTSYSYNYDYNADYVYSQSASGNMNYGSTVTLYVSSGAKPYAVGDYVCYAGNTYLYRSVPNGGGTWKGEACEGWINNITWYNGVQYIQFAYQKGTGYGWASADHFYQKTN